MMPESVNCSNWAALWSSPMLEMSGGFSASSGATLYGNSEADVVQDPQRSEVRHAPLPPPKSLVSPLLLGPATPPPPPWQPPDS